ncbi:MAG: glycosyltransferase [Saccharospirillum sp.]
MVEQSKLKLWYYSAVILLVVLLGFQVYLNFFQSDMRTLHGAQVEWIKSRLAGAESFEFAVIGNVNNSVSKFQDQIAPLIRDSDASFTLSAGNAVTSGSIESYRSIVDIFAELQHPWLLTYGSNENSDFGSFRFYERLGPHFYSFTAGNTHFIFLDATGYTSLAWQLDWLERELQSSTQRHRLVFFSKPLVVNLEELPMFHQDSLFQDVAMRQRLMALFERYQVEAVFSSELPVYADETVNGVRYITTGGAGGLIVDDDDQFHHYVRVSIDPDAVRIEPVAIDLMDPPLMRTLDSIWSAVYTFFYVSYSRFLIIVTLLVLVILKLREILNEERDYYAHLGIDASPWLKKPKRVLMFTNNFFPFISGVTLSIDRLIQGLRSQHHEVRVVAPDYPGNAARVDTLRVRTLFAFGSKKEFRLANLFDWKVGRYFNRYQPDIVHLHHPFWLGSVGLWLARRRKVPAVYTYHTRLEMYAHYVPLPTRVFRNVISHELIRRFCNRCDGVIVPTVSTEEYLRLIGVKVPLCVQPTGIDFERFHRVDAAEVQAIRDRQGIAEDDIVLISVSRLGKEKNLDFMVNAMAQIRQQSNRSVRLLLVGEGDERPHLEQLIEQSQLTGAVTLVGAVEPDAIPVYYHLADLFVFASKSETQGMVILEAMAAGLPVVAVRSSGTDDVILEGETGFKTFEKVELWAEKVGLLIKDEALRARLSKRAVALARQHDIAHFTRNIDGFYSEILTQYKR